jgi:hypothetical protein
MVESEYGLELAADALAVAAERAIRSDPMCDRIRWSYYVDALRARGLKSIDGRTLEEIERAGGQPPGITRVGAR